MNGKNFAKAFEKKNAHFVHDSIMNDAVEHGALEFLI